MFERRLLLPIQESLEHFPIAAIIGPRQVGKTTLAKQIIQQWQKPAIYLDLELQSDLFKLNDPELFFAEHRDKLVVLDEVQNKKDLFPLLRAWVDQTREHGQFLLLGSASPELIRHSSESLAGRIAYHRLFPLDITEVSSLITQTDLWIKGGFPNMLLAKSDGIAWRWMENFISTYLNRDLLQLGLNASPAKIRQLWSMLAHFNGQLFNASVLSNSLGVSSTTVKRYVDFLEEAFLVKPLAPFTFNIAKRLVKSPKIYITDTGILHHLLRVANLSELSGNPAIGNSWEAFVINQIQALSSPNIELNFYRTHNGAEVDLVFSKGLQVVATAEIKYSNTPNLTKGYFQAIEDLKAPINYVITPSSDDFYLKDHIRVCSLKTFIDKYLIP